MDSLLRCSRYAFGPNRLHYCGPDANQEILAHIDAREQDPALAKLLGAFQTLYPYLNLIARSNGITDPFATRVVDAYWIGNELLDRVGKKNLYHHLKDEKRFKEQLGSKVLSELESAIDQNAAPHHSFHVFDVWRRSGRLDHLDMLEKIDSCRISWGEITRLDGPFVEVKTRPLIYLAGQLKLGDAQIKKVSRRFEADIELESLKIGDYVTLHWGVICERINEEQLARLRLYSDRHLKIANQTI